MIPDKLQTANLFMRPFLEGDGTAVYTYWKSDPGWERFNVSVPSGFTENDADRFVAEMRARDRREKPSWAMVHDNIVVGVASLSFKQDHQTAILGYGICSDLRGRGLCNEAARRILDCAFAAYSELHTIRAHTDAANSASIRVLQKLGFSEEHTSGDSPSDDGKSLREATFRLLRTEWEAQK